MNKKSGSPSPVYQISSKKEYLLTMKQKMHRYQLLCKQKTGVRCYLYVLLLRYTNMYTFALSMCLVLWCKELFKSVFHLKMHQNNLFFFFFDISTSKSSESTKKSINLMFFQGKQALSICCLYYFFYAHKLVCRWVKGMKTREEKQRAMKQPTKI
jgi:hypothetical protein